MMHVTKMIVVRRDYRGQTLVVLTRNSKPWFDFKAVCQAVCRANWVLVPPMSASRRGQDSGAAVGMGVKWRFCSA